MQFVEHGPDIPDALLQAHEEGKVVFFCGAGISYPAGLPGFQGLVDKIYSILGTKPDAQEELAYSRFQFDATLDLLERRYPGQRNAVRGALYKVLTPNMRRKGAADTHAALLELAKNRDGAVRLVTTNFDRIFHRLILKSKSGLPEYPAPLLPIPKNSRWNGIVYLHGLLPDSPQESALNRLVVTSGDFGLAYLTERWASRFVSELFRNYIVCFVGYSINDPVLRYMMDALAADRILGEITPQAYALGDCQPGQEATKTIEWKAKGVVPILYDTTNELGHVTLHRTLKVWSEIYRDGVQGKERIVTDYAMTHPAASTKQDDFVGRMLWALSHHSGLPARRFAEFEPTPSLDWLKELSNDRYRYGDLVRFGVPALPDPDDKLTFSLIRRPAPYSRATLMALALGESMATRLDDVMFQLARWLTRHLNDPELILWLAQQGGSLHDQFIRLVENELDKVVQLERDGKIAELDRIRIGSPNAIPDAGMRTLWRFLLTGRVKSPGHDLDLYQWKERLEREGLTTTLRLALRELLAPRIALKRPLRWEADIDASQPASLRQRIDWELGLVADNVHSSLVDLDKSEIWLDALPGLANDLQQLLSDALDLQYELGDVDHKQDNTHWDLPSISKHWQNQGFRDWVSLIELLRDSWEAIYRTDSIRARHMAQGWRVLPYATFTRLALFAATFEGISPNGDWVEWLLADGAHYLWSLDTQRETMRLLVLQGNVISEAAQSQLEEGILAGPPRELFQPETEPEAFSRHSVSMIWLRLAKLQSSGCVLGDTASARLKEISAANTEWHLEVNESDEFSHWTSGSGDPDHEERREIDYAPHKRTELVAWLRQERTKGFFYEDTWRETCGKNFPVTACALCELASHNQWPAGYWREALQAWSNEKLVGRAWRYMAPLLLRMPDDVLQGIATSVTRWVQEASKVLNHHEAVFFQLCQRILNMHYPETMANDQPVSQAINHPVGHITQALLEYWFRRQPSDNDGLPSELRPLFSMLCNRQLEQYRHARVLLASRLITLFRVDREWTEAFLLPLFRWSSSVNEARGVWEGFLWSPRLYRPLLAAFKDDFLATANHVSQLGKHSRQYASFLTYAALEPADTFTNAEISDAISALSKEGLQDAAQALVQALQGAGDQREQYWRNRILPFWQSSWPKSLQLTSKRIAATLARLAIAARDEFPSAISTIRNWLQPVDHPDHIVRELRTSGACTQFPEDALVLLNAVFDDQPWAPPDLKICLGEIEQTWAAARQDRRYMRLQEYARKRLA